MVSCGNGSEDWCSLLFRTQRFAGYGKATTDHANRLADSWSDGDQFDLVPRMAQLALLSIGQALFNLDLSSERELYGKVLQVHSETLRDEFRAAVVLPDWLPLEKKRRKRWAMSQLRELISGVIQDRRDSGRDQGDVLSMLLAAVDEEGDGGQMTDQQGPPRSLDHVDCRARRCHRSAQLDLVFVGNSSGSRATFSPTN